MSKRPWHLDETDHHTADRLEQAVETGDLTSVSTILSKWSTQPHMIPGYLTAPEPGSTAHVKAIWPFNFVLYHALDHKEVEIVRFVLDCGLEISLPEVCLFVRSRSIDILEALLDHGWDINMPLAEHMSPPLW